MKDATTTLNVRGISPDTARRIKTAAAARGLTIAQYLTRLVWLHEAMRERASVSETLHRLELDTVSS